MLDKIINTSKKYNIYIYIMAIIPALIEKPDYVYVVDKETADNIKISLSTPSGGLYPIPKKFINCWSGKQNEKISINYKIFMSTFDGSSGIWTINYADIKTK